MGKLSQEEIAAANKELRDQSPLDVIRWGISQAEDSIIVSTNFRPYEAVILHLVTQVKPDITVLWVDHGYNRPATYKHAEALREQLGLKIEPYLPKYSAAHYDAVFGGVPELTPENEDKVREFSAVMKLEPFQRGMAELSPSVWITALREEQNPNRAELDIVSQDDNFGTLKLSPLYYWTEKEMEAYLSEHDLPNEWDYFDPAKADEKRECGLHAAWGREAVVTAESDNG